MRSASVIRHRSVSLVLMTALGLSCAIPAAAQSRGWSITRSHVLSSLPGAALGAMPGSQRMQVMVGLKLPDSAALAQRLERMHQAGDALYGSRMTPSQFTAAYSPTTAQVQAVKDYLSAQGFDSIEVSDNRLLITAEAPVSVIEPAFNTHLQRFRHNGRTSFANVSDIQVPQALAGRVMSVLGLQDVARARTFARATVAAVASPGLQALPLTAFATAYDANGITTAASTTVAIFMSGNLSSVLSDFQLASTQNNLPQVPVDIIQIGSASSDTSNSDEWDLDSQSSLGIAGNFKRMIWYNAASLNNADLIKAINRWVTDDAAPAANASFGECETDAQSSGFLAMADQILMQAMAQGQTLFASTGDTGVSNCPLATVGGLAIGPPVVSYPASSPYAVAVGGTSLRTDSAFQYISEAVWINSGSGISTEENAPSWQQRVLPALPVPAGKGVPDMAMDADPDSGARLIVNGQPMVVGGTSLSSPLAMGAWARIESAHGNQLGFAAPLLYAQASGPGQPAKGFNDVNQFLSGNIAYQSGPGYDYASGLGSFDVAVLSPLLESASSGDTSGADASSSGNSSGGGGGAFAPSLLILLALMGLRRRALKN